MFQRLNTVLRAWVYKLKSNNTAGLQFYQLSRFLIFFLTGIVFAKLRFPLADIAAYESVLFASSAISYFWVNGITTSLLSLYPEARERKEYILSNAFFLITAISAILVLVIFIFFKNRNSFFLLTHQNYFPVFCLYFFFTAPSFLIEYILLLKGKTKSLYILASIFGLVHIGFVILPAFFTHSIKYSVYGLIITAIVRYVVVIYQLLPAKFTPDKSIVVSTLKYSVPLMIASFIGGSGEYVDGFMVKQLFNPAAFAVYRYGAKELPLTLLLANALSLSMVPYFSGGNTAHSLDLLKSKSLKLMNWLFPVSIILVLSSKWLYSTFLSTAFQDSALIFSTYLLLIVSRLIFPQTILLGNKHTRFIMYTAIIEMAMNICFSYFLAKRIGLIGIAVGTVIAFAMDKLVQTFFVFRMYGISPQKYIPVKRFLAYSVLLLATYALIFVI